jgi:hypothetical protein
MIMILLLPQAADKGLMVLLLSEEKAQLATIAGILLLCDK